LILRRPSEILDSLSTERELLLQEVIERISTELEERYSGNALFVTLPEAAGTEYTAIRPKIEKVLKASYWRLDSICEQNDGRNEFSVVAKISPMAEAVSICVI
jgi:hypothetical protein